MPRHVGGRRENGGGQKDKEQSSPAPTTKGPMIPSESEKKEVTSREKGPRDKRASKVGDGRNGS